MYSGLTNELGVRKESEIGLIHLSGDGNMCIADTDSKLQEERCWKVIKILLSLTNGHVENNHSIFPTQLGVNQKSLNSKQSELATYIFLSVVRKGKCACIFLRVCLFRSELFSTNETRKCYMIKHSEINTGL